MPKYKNRICAGCGVSEYTASASSLCRPCSEAVKKEEKIRDEIDFLSLHGYSIIADTELNNHGHRYYTLNTPCDHTWKVTFTNFIKQISVANEKNLPPPCGICGPQRRMKVALAGYIEKNGRDYDLAVFEDYRKKVRGLSDKTYKLHEDKLNPLGLNRGMKTYHLDHKVPIIKCFKDGWAPEQAAALENLSLIPFQDNLSKGAKVE